jgi:hypothetical protein
VGAHLIAFDVREVAGGGRRREDIVCGGDLRPVAGQPLQREEALLLLQERIYTAWRNKRVVSLVSFDVTGAHNGVYKDRLLQRLQARGIPSDLVDWTDAFCSKRTVTIVVNG